MGDRFNDDQVDDMFREAPIDQRTGDFNYIEFVKILKHGKTDPDANKIEMVKLEWFHNCAFHLFIKHHENTFFDLIFDK